MESDLGRTYIRACGETFGMALVNRHCYRIMELSSPAVISRVSLIKPFLC